MSLQIQVITRDKAKWGEGVAVALHRDKDALGHDYLIKGMKSLQPVRDQFEKNSASEVSTFVAGEKKPRAVLFLSTKQVKYYSAADKLRILGSHVVKFARKNKLGVAILPLENASAEEIESILQGISAANYNFDEYKTTKKTPGNLKLVVVVEKDRVRELQELVKRVQRMNDGVYFARDLVNQVPAELYPSKMAERIRDAAKDAGLDVTIYDEKRLAKEKFNGVLTVGRGSNRPPRLTLISYKPATKSDVHLVLVGKAVTFDTGGHCLKPAKGMWEMKGDMAGGAAVAGAMVAIGKLKPSIRVTAVIPSALNAIGPDAMLPGDIIRSRSGKTVHVDNTDAEGRLLLMDGLHLAGELGATHIVDVATLTGSIVRALGEAMSGLFANDDDLAQALIQSGESVGEGFWRMPLIEEYREQLNHPVADLDNVGKGVNAGSITAALFLQEFVPENSRWAHLDIAACGLMTKQYKCTGPGATGFGVQTLVQLAENLSMKS